jgi:iron complex outermembrane recepter protein
MGRGTFAVIMLGLPVCAVAQPTASSLADLSLEDLANLQITSVSRRAERLADAPASIYVITAEDIRRSGVTSLPEALRLAPILQVARIDASQYAISGRGFNNAIGNKLLVLIDGRTVYTPLFSGVFWDQQDVMLEDVERIEVITGPGATLWGANAVNGVINVLTRSARDTQGTLVSAGAGNMETGVAARHGIALGEQGGFRVYGKATRLQNTEQANGTAVADGRDWGQAGFRADWKAGRDGFTLQGDGYNGRAEDRGPSPFAAFGGVPQGRIETSGANLLARWTRQLDTSELRVQAYYDHTERDDINLFRPIADIFDVEAQHGFRAGENRILWGGGYRHGRDKVAPGMAFGLVPVGFIPSSRSLEWWNVFVQGEFALSSTVDLTAGVKVEHNDYTGEEYLPSLRLAWKASQSFLLWGALSRAVRAPSRIDRELFFPTTPPFAIAGGPNFESEVAEVVELGVRGQASRTLNYSLTAFWHEWDRLRSGSATVPALIENKVQGPAYGVEGWGAWQAAAALRLSAGFSTLRKRLEAEAGASASSVNDPNLSNDPEFQWMLRASLNPAPRHELDATLRRVGKLPNPAVPEYTAFDLRYAWRASRSLDLSATLQNAFDPEHPEFGAAASRSEIPRALYLAVRWAP